MKTHYKIIKNSDSKACSYGIKIVKERFIHDVSKDYSLAKLLVDACNRNSVDFDQFDDVFENFAEDFKTF
ncbi:MAG: hypothetical protein ACI4Q8_01595 [Ruminococcus sp.]